MHKRSLHRFLSGLRLSTRLSQLSLSRPTSRIASRHLPPTSQSWLQAPTLVRVSWVVSSVISSRTTSRNHCESARGCAYAERASEQSGHRDQRRSRDRQSGLILFQVPSVG